MADAQPSPQQAFLSSRAEALKTIWSEAAGTRFAPPRDAITLSAIHRLAPWFWVTEIVNGGADFRYRLAGGKVEYFFGRSLRNVLVSELHDVRFAQRIRKNLQRCCTGRGPVLCGPEISEYEDKDFWEIASIALPLSDDGLNVTHVMGVFEFWPIGTHPELAQAMPFCNPIFSV